MLWNDRPFKTKFELETGEVCTAEYGTPIDLDDHRFYYLRYFRDQDIMKVSMQSDNPRDLHYCGSISQLAREYEVQTTSPVAPRPKNQLARSRVDTPFRLDRSGDTSPKSDDVARTTIFDGKYFSTYDKQKNCYFNQKTGEAWEHKSRKNLHTAYVHQEANYFANVEISRSFFLTFTSDVCFTFNALSTVLDLLVRWLKSNWRVTYGLAVLEPHENGKWHLHLVVCFADPPSESELSEAFAAWARRHCDTPTDKQTKTRKIATEKYKRRLFCYLNPLSPKKKDRLRFYPRGGKVFRTFKGGKTPPLRKPITAMVKGSTIKELIKKANGREATVHNERYEFCKELETNPSITLHIYYIINSRACQSIFANFNNFLSREKPRFRWFCDPNDYGFAIAAGNPFLRVPIGLLGDKLRIEAEEDFWREMQDRYFSVFGERLPSYSFNLYSRVSHSELARLEKILSVPSDR